MRNKPLRNLLTVLALLIGVLGLPLACVLCPTLDDAEFCKLSVKKQSEAIAARSPRRVLKKAPQPWVRIQPKSTPFPRELRVSITPLDCRLTPLRC